MNHDVTHAPAPLPTKVSLQDILDKITKATYTVLPNGRTTICQLTLENGFTVEGQSACVDPANFNQALGEKYAYEKALDKIWELEGYLLAQKRHEASEDIVRIPLVNGSIVALQANAIASYGRIDRIARVCHEVNKAYCEALGDNSQPTWEAAPEWQRESARMGVDLHLSGDFGPEASHISWMSQKLNDGWKYGVDKDPVNKTHPCLVPFDQLSPEQQAKDYIFRAVVHALR